jgi:hypothetical protein
MRVYLSLLGNRQSKPTAAIQNMYLKQEKVRPNPGTSAVVRRGLITETDGKC